MKTQFCVLLICLSSFVVLASGNASRAVAADVKGQPERVGPVHFLVPEGWEVDLRDRESIRMRKKDSDDRKTFMNVSLYPAAPGAQPYTPEGINRLVVRMGQFDRFPRRTESIKIGKEGRSAVWTGTSRADVGLTMQHIYVASQGGVYMIHTGYAPDDKQTEKAFEQLLQSITFDDAKP